jgi:hypothetical protein
MPHNHCALHEHQVGLVIQTELQYEPSVRQEILRTQDKQIEIYEPQDMSVQMVLHLETNASLVLIPMSVKPVDLHE